MGDNRYKIIKTKIHKEWIVECPVKIEKSQLSLDTQKNQIVLQIKMSNISDKVIRSVYLDIQTFDDAMDPVLNLYDITYTAVNAKPKSEFGDRKPVLLESENIANVEIIVCKIVFIDDTVWRNDEKTPGLILPEQKPLIQSDEFYEQIIEEFKEINIKSKYWYESNNNYWRCTCGQANKNKDIKCCYCGTMKEWLEKHFDRQYLYDQQKKYNEAEVFRKEKEEEEKLKLDEKKISKEKRGKKFAIMLVGFTLILLIIFILIKIYASTPVTRLVESSNIKKVENLINLGINIDEVDEKGRIALCIAVENNQNEFVALLTENEADVNFIGPNGYNLLTTAYHNYNYEILKLLLSVGAKITNINQNGQNVIDISYKDSNYEVISILIDHGLNDKTLLLSGDTLLNTSIKNSDFSMVELLVNRGFSVNNKNMEGKTPLESAYETKNQDIITLLQDKGAKAFLQERIDITFGNSYDTQKIYIVERGETYTLKNANVETTIDGNNKETKIFSILYVYIGDFVNNEITGTGKLYYKDTNHLIYSGGWNNGLYSGEGTIYWKDNNQKYLDGEFVNGNPIKYTRYYSDGDINDSGTISEDGVSNSD